MSDVNLLGSWVRRFLLEHLVRDRNLARNTQRSYRDTLALLIPFVAGKLNTPVDRLTILDVSADLVRLFLLDLQESRQCGIATRNQRLAAVHALARFIENTVWNTFIGAVRFVQSLSRKRRGRPFRIWKSQRWTLCCPPPIA